MSKPVCHLKNDVHVIIYFTRKIINVFCDLLIHCIANIELFGVKKRTVLFSGAC